MFTYTFQDRKTQSLYLQLYQHIKDDITGGKLPPGEKLPSKRAAAKNLGVSVITVENAYAALQSEGYIFSKPKKGYFVSEISTLYHAAVQKTEPAQVHLSPKPDYRYDFTSNGVIPENFPFSVWAKLMREDFHALKQDLMMPSPAGGIPALQEAICAHLKQFRGMNIAPEQVIIGAGTEYLYSLIIQLLGGEKCYAIQNPGYRKIQKIYHSVGVKTVPIAEDTNGMRASLLEASGATVAHISPSHAFPSGTVMSISARHKILNWANKNEQRYIIEDDYDSEFRLDGKPLPALQSLDSAGKVIYVNTFTKSLSPTIRIGYMVLPQALAEKFYRTLGFYACTVSTFEQYTLAKFISEGYFEKHINRMRNYYKKTRNRILEEIKKSPLAAISEVAEEEAGLHFLLKLNTALPDAFLKNKSAQNGVNLSFLSEYYLTDTAAAPPHILVMNYSGIPWDAIPDAVKALEKAIDQ